MGEKTLNYCEARAVDSGPCRSTGIGDFSLDTEAYRLLRESAAVAASPKLIDVLAYLVARPSQLVRREDLFRTLWPDVIVTDNALTQLISELRQALADPPATPRYVQTVARRGYRFIAAVELAPSVAAQATSDPTGPRQRSRETSSLDALRAVSEGRLQLESLDRTQVEAAIENFERAIVLDPNYAAGYVGLANAHFWQYESSRCQYRPDSALLALAVNEARRAIALAPELAEAHATLAYLLTSSGRADEGRAAARRAIALEPNYWAHYFRLANASWGEERLQALRRSLDLYPAFPFAHFQMAMVHVGRHALDQAQHVVREGLATQEALAAGRSRFPASGLHWMLGSILLARHDVAGALDEFDRELTLAGQGLYAREFSVAAFNGRGFALMCADAPEEAEDAFRSALAQHPEQAKAHLGLALMLKRRKRATQAADELAEARQAIDRLRHGGRTIEAALMIAGEHAMQERPAAAVRALEQLLIDTLPGVSGWTIPIEPLYEPLTDVPAFKIVIAQLSVRAR